MNKGYEASKEKILAINKARKLKTYEDYIADPKLCLNCQSPISFEHRHDNKFCSRSCSATYNNTKKPKKYHCIVCGKVLNYGKYCSGKCQSAAQNKELVTQWLAGLITGNNNATINIQLVTAVRRWCLDRAGNKCELCGWAEVNPITGKSPLQIHHKDGNAKNSVPDNLQVLCPNCHSLTPTFGGSNRGNGRKERYKQV